MRRAAFLDRDGVINKDSGYVHRCEDLEFTPGAIEGMRLLQEFGYVLVVITNQSGLAHGKYSEAQYQAFTAKLLNKLAHNGIKLESVYHCPHHPLGSVSKLAISCDCRKPAPGMLLKAAQELGLSLKDSLLIGDRHSDIQAARAAGVGHAYQVRSDNPESEVVHAEAEGHYASLLDCVLDLLAPAGVILP